MKLGQTGLIFVLWSEFISRSVNAGLQISMCSSYGLGVPGPKFTDDLRTILRHLLDLRQPRDNWQIHRLFMAVLRPIF